MGGFYGSVQVHTDDRDRVKRVAEAVARAKSVKCLLGPALGGWVGVYPENGGQDESFGAAMAHDLPGDVLHVLVHDDDVFAYWLWRDGTLVDSFYDPPGYFGEEQRAEQEKMAGNPEALSPLLAKGKKPEAIADLLRRDGPRATFQVERLDRFARLLGIRNAVTSFEYLQEDDHEGVRGWKQFEELPAAQVADAKRAAREQRQQLAAEKKRLRRAGLLLAEVVKKHLVPRTVALGDGFLVGWAGFGNVPPLLEMYRPPWKAPQALDLGSVGQVNAIARDRAGRRVAVVLGKRVALYDTSNWTQVLEVAERDWAVGCALAADGALLAHASREEVVVTRTDGTGPVATLAGGDRYRLAFHPSGRWLVGGSQQALGRVDLTSPPPLAWKDLFIGGKAVTAEVGALVRAHIAAIDFDRVEKHWREQLDKLAGEANDQLRESMRRQLERMRAQFEQAKAGTLTVPTQGREQPITVGFTADGRLMWCGTQNGLRVYDWDRVAGAAGDDMPPPRFAHNERTATEQGIPGGYIYAVAQEPGGAGLLFAGMAGVVRRLDLADGSVRDLLTMPEREQVIQLALSDDGAVLSTCAQPGMLQFHAKRDMRHVWAAWSYPAITAP